MAAGARPAEGPRLPRAPAQAPPGLEQDGLLTKGVLAQWHPGCVRVPYAYGVLLDSDGGQHLFARDHLRPGLLACLLAEGDALLFHTWVPTAPCQEADGAAPRASWACCIRRDAGGRSPLSRRPAGRAAARSRSRASSSSCSSRASASSSGPRTRSAADARPAAAHPETANRPRWKVGVLRPARETGGAAPREAEAVAQRPRPPGPGQPRPGAPAPKPLPAPREPPAAPSPRAPKAPPPAPRPVDVRSSSQDAVAAPAGPAQDVVAAAVKEGTLQRCAARLLRADCSPADVERALVLLLETPLAALLDEEIARVNDVLCAAASTLRLGRPPTVRWSGVSLS